LLNNRKWAEGYYNGKIDKLISAVTDRVWSFPTIVLALGVAITSWPGFTRVIRAKVQSMVNWEFVLAARSIGESDSNIILRYLLPNIIARASIHDPSFKGRY
jgi:peptide/nickel transport system permease protein